MKRRLEAVDAAREELLPQVFTALFGAFLGLALVKFGNPPIMEKWVTAPANIYEFLLGSPWPIAWAYALLVLVTVVGVLTAKWEMKAPLWLIALPLAWVIWQCLAAVWTVNPVLTKPTLAHFFACVLCFYLGLFALGGVRRILWLWAGLLCGLLIVLVVGWEQRLGGLEQTRRYFFLYIYPHLNEVSPEYLKKISSTRIFSTLFYPNALAGAILLLLPAMLEFIWHARERFTPAARVFLVATIGIGGLGCLYWSGSKGGWLLMLVLGLIWLLRLPFKRTFKIALVAAMLVAGLAGFFWKYSGFFRKGATSVSARFDYWAAAVHTTMAHPLVGTGPGTFSIAYQKLKRPESEMARLAHNDYLEQASDSGLPGFIFYSVFVIGVLVFTAPGLENQNPSLRGGVKLGGFGGREETGRDTNPGVTTANTRSGRWISFALWLGLLGWALHGFMEFGLYIPGLAWPAFAFMGVLLGRRNTTSSWYPSR
jgi:O-antigen ligase